MILELDDQNVAEHTTVRADELTNARGGKGPWVAPPGGLWMSALWRPQDHTMAAPRVTLAATWGLREGIRKATGIAPGIKWPNDLIVEGKKIGGVLVEARVEERQIVSAAVGVRVNANNPVQELPPPLQERACSLAEVQSRETDLDELQERVTECLTEARGLLDEPDTLVKNVVSCWTQKGASVRLDLGHGFVEGEAQGISDYGRLEVASDGETRLYGDPSMAKCILILDTE